MHNYGWIVFWGEHVTKHHHVSSRNMVTWRCLKAEEAQHPNLERNPNDGQSYTVFLAG
jgi:hypothetical protein